MSRSLTASTLFLAVQLSWVLVGASRAALLAEIGINVSPAFDLSPPVENSLLYGFTTFSRSPTLSVGEWQRQITSADIGMTFEAPADITARIIEGLTRADVDISVRVDSIVYGKSLEQLQTVGWEICCGRATFNKSVPDIRKVPVNRVTMTVDSFHFERVGDNAITGGAHTIRIYGIPEPNTWMSIAFYSGWLLCLRRPKG
jgi:hypothetical protein